MAVIPRMSRIMYEKTMIGLAIATILIAYMSAFILSNQAFAVSGTIIVLSTTKIIVYGNGTILPASPPAGLEIYD